MSTGSSHDRVAAIVRSLNGRRSGASWICRCPAHDDRRPSLSVAERDGKVLVCCRAGCPQDAVIGALRRRNLWAGKWGGKPPKALEPGSFDASRDSATPRDPMKSWRNAAPFVRGSPVDTYLKARGIELTDNEARSLRFSPALWHWPTQSLWPAMLARVSLASGVDLTTHQTFLEPDGSAKASLGDQARLFAAGSRTAGGGVWFGAADPAREFIVAEGIESTLSAMRLFSATAGCAGLSANGIRTLILPPEARRVRVFADRDALGQGVLAARQARRRWLAEGRTIVVSIADRVGLDPNDLWRGKA